MRQYEIYEEGYCATGECGRAHFIGVGYGETFLDACEEFIKRTGKGEIRIDPLTGKKYACDWGCEWHPTLSEAAKSFG